MMQDYTQRLEVTLDTTLESVDVAENIVTRAAEAAGFDEVILYFNVGMKPHNQVKDEMARFMTEVAPAFGGAAKEHAA